MYLIIYDGHEKLSEIELRGQPATMGSSDECTVVLPGDEVSPVHAVLEPRGNSYILRDPEGSRGMLLNGRTVEEDLLQNGDSIQIGRYTLRVASSASARMEHGTITDENGDAPGPDSASSRSLERLSALARELGALDRPQAFLDRILETVLVELDADRASIFLNGPEAMENSGGTAALAPVAVRSHPTGMDRASSALCAPLSQGREVHGVIYIERGTGRPPFEERESRLLNTIATISGLGITNARTLARSLGEKHRLGELRREIIGKFARHLHSMVSALDGELPLLRPLVPENSFESEAMRNIERNSREIGSFIQQFLEFAELEMVSSHATGKKRLTALDLLLRRAMGAAGEEARSRRILISNHLREWTPQIAADPDRLQLALNTIILNLIRLSPEGSILTIHSGGEGDRFRLDISSDEVPSLSVLEVSSVPESLELFDLFAGANFPSAGLGIEIARQIILEHGGDLRLKDFTDIRSRRGITFSIHLPVAGPVQDLAPYEAAASATA